MGPMKWTAPCVETADSSNAVSLVKALQIAVLATYLDMPS